MRARRFRAFLPVLALALLAGCGAPARAEAPPELLPPVNVVDDTAPVTRRDITTVTRHNGKVVLRQEELLFGDTSLVVSQINCIPGDRVSAGDVLVRLDTEDLEELVEEAERELAALEEDYRLQEQRGQLDWRDIDLREQNLTAEYLKQEEPRDHIPYNKKLEELEHERELLRLRDEKAARDLEIEVEYRREVIATHRKALAEAVVVAPFDGVVVRVEALAGVAARPFEPAVILADESRCQVMLASADNATVDTSASAEGIIDGVSYPLVYAPLPMEDMLVFVLDGLKSPYLYSFAQEDLVLPPGSPVSVRLSSPASANALSIPVNAVYSSGSSRYVYRIDPAEDGSTVKTMAPVETGRRNESYVEILEGLREGDVVFVN